MGLLPICLVADSTDVGYDNIMSRMIEFETELTGSRTLDLPPEIASALPAKGRATIVVVVDMDPEDVAWQTAAYEQFLSGDSEEDAGYDRYR